MTAPNPAIGAKPGQAFIARDGSTWVWRPAGAPTPDRMWARIGLRGRLSRRTQKEAEAAGLTKLGTSKEAWDEGFEAGCAWQQSSPSGIPNDPPLNPYADGPAAAPAPLDPGKPEHLRTPEALRFAAAVMVEAARGRPQPAAELMNAKGLRAEADRLDREHAEAEQDATDRKRAEEIAMVAWADGDGYAQWHNAPEQHRTDLIAAALAGIRAGRAEVATNG